MPKPQERTFADLQVGDAEHFSVVVTPEIVDEFARLSGDYNPLHTDESYAATTVFKSRIAHGMLAGAFFSRIVGMHLPGLYALYLSQTIECRKPIFLNTEVTVEGSVTAKNEARRTITVAMEVKNTQTGTVLVSGDALVFVSE